MLGTLERSCLSAYAVKTKLSLFERPVKMTEGGVFNFAISSLIPKLFKFSYYANKKLIPSEATLRQVTK